MHIRQFFGIGNHAIGRAAGRILAFSLESGTVLSKEDPHVQANATKVWRTFICVRLVWPGKSRLAMADLHQA
jgi:hypothetical protein